MLKGAAQLTKNGNNFSFLNHVNNFFRNILTWAGLYGNNNQLFADKTGKLRSYFLVLRALIPIQTRWLWIWGIFKY